MTTRAAIGSKSGPMFDPAVAGRVAEMIRGFYANGDDVDVEKLIEEKCGRFVRGKHAGELRGWAHWKFVSAGGWYRGDGLGRVVYPGQVLGVSIVAFGGEIYLGIGERP